MIAMKTLLSAIGAVIVLFLGTTFLLGSARSTGQGGACLPTDPSLSIAGYSGDQLTNAATIINAGAQQGVPQPGIVIGVMTAIGESSLRNLDYDDDATNPDGSTADGGGLFQQQVSAGWGTWEQVMDPAYAASAFYGGPNGPNAGSPRGLLDVPGWEDMEPSHAAHAVQINADENHYTKYLADAEAIVTALACAAGGTGEWIVPSAGVVTGQFGECGGVRPGRCHEGTDLADGTCYGPIWAAGAGTVTSTGYNGRGGGFVIIDHGEGISTGYYHMRTQDILVSEGASVDAGTQVGRMGNEGNSYGCHLHYEVRINGEAINAEPFMIEHGAPLPLP